MHSSGLKGVLPVRDDVSSEPGLLMFKDALADERIGLQAERVVDVKDLGNTLYSECLARLIDPAGCVRLASEFVPAVEASGEIALLDRYVMGQVLEELCADSSIVLGCNISAETLSDENTWSSIFGLISEYSSVADRLVLEVTETRPLGIDRYEARKRFTEVQNLGCRVAVDDFGVGHFSPSTLLFVDADIVKIDASIMKKLRVGRDGVSNLDCIVGFASCTAPVVVVEGVETPEQLILVRRAGATHAQGYLFPKAEIMRRSSTGGAT